jgi:uncharacterized protein (UPF0332 family)
MMTATAYLVSARRLISSDATDVDIRRAISAVYYALFHHVCRHFSHVVVRNSDVTYTRAWLQTYRYLDHKPARDQCEKIERSNETQKLGFPAEILRFATVFKEMQQRRLNADYNPAAQMTSLDAYSWVLAAEQAIADFENASPEHQRAFVLFVCLKPKAR